MSNAFFHDIKFEIEDNYTLVEKSSVLELFEKRKNEIDFNWLNMFKTTLDQGRMALIYNPDLFNSSSNSYSEYFNFVVSPENYMPINDEEDLREEKLRFQHLLEVSYGVVPKIYKFELSNSISFARVCTYCEMDGIAENTFSAQYSFFISFESTENYTITMTCENKFKDESINRLDKIIRSISKN